MKQLHFLNFELSVMLSVSFLSRTFLSLCFWFFRKQTLDDSSGKVSPNPQEICISNLRARHRRRFRQLFCFDLRVRIEAGWL